MKGNGKTHRLDALFVMVLFMGASTPLPSLAGTPIPDPVGFGDQGCWDSNFPTGELCFTTADCSGSDACGNFNRYISFTPPTSDSVGGEPLAIRVKLVDLPGFPEFNGEVRWVGVPADYPLTRNPSDGTFKAAQLECDPVLMDWGAVGALYVYGFEVVPGSVYEVQTATSDCLALGEETCFSPPAMIPTTPFGALNNSFTVANFGAVTVPIFTFVHILHPLHVKHRVQMALPLLSPGNDVTMLDVLWGRNAQVGIPYPTQGPLTCPRSLIGCGDMMVIPPEECDDGNAEDGDGCDPNCRFEDRSLVVSLKPVEPTASLAQPYPPGTVINGSEIVLPRGGVRVFLELTFAGWDPDLDGVPTIGTWQVALDDSGFANGVAGTLASPVEDCSSNETCEDYFGQGSACAPTGSAEGPPAGCAAGFFAREGEGTVVRSSFKRVDRSFGGFRFGHVQRASVPDSNESIDPGTDAYAGTLVLDVPEDALGTFVIGILEGYPHSFVNEGENKESGFGYPPFLPIAEYRPAVITVQNERNRYLTFAPPTPVVAGGEPVAIRAKIIDAPQFPAAIGQVHWAGVPTEASDGVDNPAIMISQLQCEPVVRDWSDAPLLSLYGQAVVPGSTYEIHTATAECLALGVEECLSEPIVLRTAKWGDAFAPWGGSAQPNFGDVSALLEKFRGLPTAPSLTFTDLMPDIPNQIVNFADVSAGVDAFRGIPYSFAGPQPCDP